MSVKRSNIKTTPFGGAVPILKKIKEFRIPQVIRACLGKRVEQSKYGYEDVLIAWVMTALCGGTRLEHISKLQKKLNTIPGLKLPSHDTLGRVMKQLATDNGLANAISKEEKGKVIETVFNDNVALNRMLIKATKNIGALKSGPLYTLDIDATFLASQCRGGESKLKENGKNGFAPFVCLIGELPVYISLRKGDAGARFRLFESLQTCLNLLDESGIRIGRVISDAAGYSRDVTELLDRRGIKFVMRFPVNGKMQKFKDDLVNAKWNKTEIKTANNVWDCEIASVGYQMYYPRYKSTATIPMRVVAIRFPTDKTILRTVSLSDRVHLNKMRNRMHKLYTEKKLKNSGKKYTEIHWKEIDDYTYKFYVTNDFNKPSEEVVVEYNKRGDAERKFSYMKSDFGWRLPPFMWMNQNNVFLIAASLANNIFVGMKMLFKTVIPEHINLTERLASFQRAFINATYLEFGRGDYVFLNSDIPYEKIM